MSALDQSLDQVRVFIHVGVASHNLSLMRPQLAAARRVTRKPRRGARSVAGGAADSAGAAKGAAGARARYTGTIPAADGNRVTTAPAASGTPVQADATKILVSNLPADVNEPQVRVRPPSFKRF